MINYGEELVHWYFRLNGFFLIDNFVLHRRNNINERTSDTDLLAVRFPYVYEETGGNEDDWDEILLSKFAEEKIIGIMCEVKTTTHYNPNNLFKRNNIEKAFNRFGFISKDLQQDNICELENNKIITVNNYQIAKGLISPDNDCPREDVIHLELEHINNFILNRMRKYSNRKYGDRIFFPSSLLQYIIWTQQ